RRFALRLEHEADHGPGARLHPGRPVQRGNSSDRGIAELVALPGVESHDASAEEVETRLARAECQHTGRDQLEALVVEIVAVLVVTEQHEVDGAEVLPGDRGPLRLLEL